jgi:hypothetical protein
LPAAVAGGVFLVAAPPELSVGHGAAVVGAIAGAHLLLAVPILLINRQPGLLPFLPTYPLFRVLVLYFALEAFLSLPLTASGERRERRMLAGPSRASG